MTMSDFKQKNHEASVALLRAQKELAKIGRAGDVQTLMKVREDGTSVREITILPGLPQEVVVDDPKEAARLAEQVLGVRQKQAEKKKKPAASGTGFNFSGTGTGFTDSFESIFGTGLGKK